MKYVLIVWHSFDTAFYQIPLERIDAATLKKLKSFQGVNVNLLTRQQDKDFGAFVEAGGMDHLREFIVDRENEADLPTEFAHTFIFGWY
jgi:hypothetical protein